MSAPFTSTATALTRTSLWFVAAATVALLLADIEIIAAEPWFELGRIGLGLLTPDFFATESLLDALLNTLAFALVGVFIANCAGFLLALCFQWRVVRYFCAFIRAIHELFWALLFLQLFGLSTLTGLLAIAIPYSGIFARVYAEILEECDQSPVQALPAGSDRISTFLYTRLPLAFRHLKTYSLYRLECGIRSSAVLGFIGLPTLGFHLETAFSQGLYSEASALLYLFFAVIALLRYWMKLRLLPVYLLAAWLWLPTDSGFSWPLLVRFFGEDIVPAPVRQSGLGDTAALQALADWCWQLLSQQAATGALNTLVLSLLALVASGVLALLFLPLVSRLFLGRAGRSVGHVGLVIFRSTPELILAFVATLIVGPSMLPAIFALSLHNGAIIGYLIGQFSNSLSLREDAPRGLNLYGFEVLPRVYRQFLAFLFYRWEVIMRETAILGILGIHTLGFYIDTAFEDLRFDRALFLILLTAALNLLADSVSRRIRSGMHLNDLKQQASC